MLSQAEAVSGKRENLRSRVRCSRFPSNPLREKAIEITAAAPASMNSFFFMVR